VVGSHRLVEGLALSRIDEGDRGRAPRHLATGRLDLQGCSRHRMLHGHPDVADVLLESRRPHGVRYMADTPAVFAHGPVFGAFGAQLRRPDLYPDESTLHPFAPNPRQGGLAEVVRGLVLDEALHAHD